MVGVSRILIDLQDAAGRSIQKLVYGTGGADPIKVGDEVEVAFPSITIDGVPYSGWKLLWRRMTVYRIGDHNMVTVQLEPDGDCYQVDLSRVRRL